MLSSIHADISLVEYHPEARVELLAAARLYADEARQLGQDFRDAIRTAESLIEEAPQRWPRYTVHGTQNGTQKRWASILSSIAVYPSTRPWAT